MKNSEQYLKNLLKKTINETLEEKADNLMSKIKKSEMEEGFDSPKIKFDRKNKDYDKDEFKKMRFRPYEFEKDYDLDSTTEDEFEYRIKTKNIDLDPLFSDDDDDLDPFIEDGDIQPINEGKMCEQCGGGLNENEMCEQCGSMYEETYDLNPENEFDYVEEEDDFDFDEDENNLPSDEEILDRHCNSDNPEDIKICQDRKNMLGGEIKEKLYGKQKMLDKNKNNRIDSEDFKLLRKNKVKSKVEEEEIEEGNKFTEMLAKTPKGGKFKLGGKTYTDKSDYNMKESTEYHIKDRNGDIVKLTENELVDLIENIVYEQKTSGLKTIGKPKGLTTYEKAHKGSGKENLDYIKSVEKKMKDYLKDGSKGKYDMNPKMFPQGNGELAKMDKKTFKLTDDLEDFNYEIAGQNFPVPDAIDYNEEWMEKLFKGNSMTGNAPGGNALESKTNDRFNKMRKKNTLKKLKDQSYKRVPQPVFNEKTGSENGKGLNIKLETTESKNDRILNEEFDRMKELFKYNQNTQ
jgi:hypothetical protein